MEEKKSHAHLYAWLILLLLICGASIFKFFIEPRLTALPEEPVMGQIGSTHTHASLYILIGNKRLNFCESKYMLASQAVHFEDNNCHVIHKHATGVTLQTFLKSINVLLTRNCIETSDEQKYCADGTNLLQAVINGMEVPIESLAH